MSLIDKQMAEKRSLERDLHDVRVAEGIGVRTLPKGMGAETVIEGSEETAEEEKVPNTAMMQHDTRDLKAMRAEIDAFVTLSDDVLLTMDSSQLEAHGRIAMRADAPMPYIDRVRELGLDADIEEKQLAHADVGFEVTGGGRGKMLKVDPKLCSDKELIKECNEFDKKRNDLSNSFRVGELKNNKEEYDVQLSALHDRKEAVRQLIEADVGAAYYAKTGSSLDENAKRMKLQHKQVTKAIGLLHNVASSSKDGSESLGEALKLHKGINAELFGEDVSNKFKQNQAAMKAENKEARAEKKAAAEKVAAEKAAEEKAADPEKYAVMKKAADEEAALKAAESAEKEAEKKAEKEAAAAATKAVAKAKAAAKLLEKASAGKAAAKEAEVAAAMLTAKVEEAKNAAAKKATAKECGMYTIDGSGYAILDGVDAIKGEKWVLEHVQETEQYHMFNEEKNQAFPIADTHINLWLKKMTRVE